MTLTSLQALSWSTVTGAVVSALLLASGEPGWPDLARLLGLDASRPAAAKPAPVARRDGGRRVDSTQRTAPTTTAAR
jgi:hypothetical protein